MSDSRHDPSRWVISDEVLSDLRRLLPDPHFEVPDIVGTVEGWRAWGVHYKDIRVPRLFSVTQSAYYWAPRKQGVAQCLRAAKVADRCHGEAPPREGCTCGFYSAKTLEHLVSMSYHHYDADRNGMFHVVGRVANWGKVIEGSQGWRTQFAYPLELFVPYEAWRLVEPLSRLYGVPAALKDTLGVPTTKENT